MKKLTNYQIAVFLTIISFKNLAQIKVDNTSHVGIGTLAPDVNCVLTVKTNPFIYSNFLVDAQALTNYKPSTTTMLTDPTCTAYRVYLTGYSNPDRFFVTGAGNVYSYGGYYGLSDSRVKKNISSIENPLEKILKINGITYNLINDKLSGEKVQTNTNASLGKMNSSQPTYSNASSTQPATTSTLSPEILAQMESENERKKMGFIAQDLEKIVPEVVRTSQSGHKAVAYQELVALLVEGMKEQQVQINLLKESVNQQSLSKNSSLDLNEIGKTANSDLVKKSALFQNAPNPFNTESSIKYVVNDFSKSCFIHVYDISGNKKKSIPILEKGAGQIRIEANELGKGLYFYSLVLDGNIVDSKNMLITD